MTGCSKYSPSRKFWNTLMNLSSLVATVSASSTVRWLTATSHSSCARRDSNAGPFCASRWYTWHKDISYIIYRSGQGTNRTDQAKKTGIVAVDRVQQPLVVEKCWSILHLLRSHLDFAVGRTFGSAVCKTRCDLTASHPYTDPMTTINVISALSQHSTVWTLQSQFPVWRVCLCMGEEEELYKRCVHTVTTVTNTRLSRHDDNS